MKSPRVARVVGGSLFWSLTAAAALGGWDIKADTEAAARWVQKHLEVPAQTLAPQSELQVWSCYGGVLCDRRAGRPLTMADREFQRGVIAHAPSRLVVQLDSPGATFSTTAGLDSNECTRPGLGSVVLRVLVDGKVAAQTPVMREGMAGAPLQVELGGATRFALEATDAGDGVASDHADWADAKVVLTDGRELWLSELPLSYGDDRVPLSFVYDGTPSQWLLPQWNRQEQLRELDQNRSQRITTWVDPRTALEVRCESVEYRDFPVVEWTAYFRNNGSAETPILENIQALDVRLEDRAGGECVLRSCRGDACTPDSFQPLTLPLPVGHSRTFAPPGGRPTEEAFPYYNLDMAGGGVIVAIGWPGQWSASFSRETDSIVHVKSGQQLTHFKLLPGEQARTPRMTLLFWQGGDWIRAQNLWRRWMVQYNMPHPGGKPVATHYGSCWSVTLNPSAAEELAIVDGFQREGIHLDYYFIDAGWYPNRGNWVNTGTWEVDSERFPHGIREVAERVHANGSKFVLWFEPERVVTGSWLAVEHPEWVLHGNGGQLLNLGHPDAWHWVVERIDSLITREGVDVYRQDFNMQPLDCWRQADAPDRQGLSEMRHIEGYLAFWDELLRRHPEMYIDTCASGGRRNDLETLRRSVPLLRSDCFAPAEAQQAHTMGLALWFPYFGSGMAPHDVYWYRSCIFPASRVGLDTRLPDQDYALLKRMIDEFHAVEKYLLGDYYPLTSHSLASDVWAAWQFDRPEEGEGMVQVFRRDDSPYEVASFRLRGLDRQAVYELHDFDQPGRRRMSGEALMESGLPIQLLQRRSSCLLTYRQVTD